MTTTYECCQCGGTYAARETLRELCPRCLFATALPEESPAQPEAGRRFLPPKLNQLAPYFPKLQILELIGHGGMSAVYKARQPELDRFVTLKILPPEVAGAAGAERFLREAQALASLSHPGIVGIHEFGKAGPWYFLVLEYVDGSSLRQLLGSQPLPPAETLRVIQSICAALEYAHGEGVIHRDIKPENILLTSKGEVKLVDFGLAKFVTRDEPALTATNQVVGTFRYMAPEQLRPTGRIDSRSDLYSLGVVFYELLTGELPVGRFPPPSRTAAIDPRLDQMIHKSIERDPARRYQSVAELRSDLAALAGRHGAFVSSRQASAAGQQLPLQAKSAGRDLLRWGLFLAYVMCFYHFLHFRADHVPDVYYTHRVGQPDAWLTMRYRHEALSLENRSVRPGLDVDMRFDTGAWAVLALGVATLYLQRRLRPGLEGRQPRFPIWHVVFWLLVALLSIGFGATPELNALVHRIHLPSLGG